MAITISGDGIPESSLQISNTPTNGQFLSAQSGNTGGLTWAAASGGGGSMEFISKTTASNVSSVDFTGLSMSGYTQFRIIASDVYPASSTMFKGRVLNTSNAALTDSDYGSKVVVDGAVVYTSSSRSDFLLDGSFTATSKSFMTADYILSPDTLTVWMIASINDRTNSNGTAPRQIFSSNVYQDSSAISFGGITFYSGSGNINGTFALYGIKDS